MTEFKSFKKWLNESKEKESLNESVTTFILWGVAVYSIWMLFWKYLRYYVDKYREHPEEQPIYKKTVKLQNKTISNLDKFTIWAFLGELKLSEKLIIRKSFNTITIITDHKEEIKIDKEKKLLILSISRQISIDQEFINKLEKIIEKYY